jgi:hypothetical protein
MKSMLRPLYFQGKDHRFSLAKRVNEDGLEIVEKRKKYVPARNRISVV